MRAVRVHEFGGPEVLAHEEVPKPEPAADELLVRVHAAGVNPIDCIVRSGEFGDPFEAPLPWIPGWDLSGVVESTGDDVTAFDPGDAVYGMVRMPDPGNAYAEYATVPAADVAPKPASLDHVEAAGVPMVALTAWRALYTEGGLTEDGRVLVHAAAGGVGHVAVQFATWTGAEVVGTASGSNEAFLRELGVDEFVNYREQRFEDAIDDVDLAIDAIGGENLERTVEVVDEGGTLVTLPMAPPDDLTERFRDEYGVETRWFSVEPDASTLTAVARLLDAGHVEPTISGVRPLADAGAAHEASETGHVRGKLVLDVTE